jgi:helicase
MGPVMRPDGEEIEIMAVQTERHREEFFLPPPNEWEDRFAFEEYLGEVKTAMILDEWIEEASEDHLLEKHRVQPGDLYRIIENGKWLLHATQELSDLLKEREIQPLVYELNERVAKGIKKELLPLARLDGVGRTRGRILYNAGYKGIEEIRRANIDELTNLPTIGPRLAKKIKEQVGGFVRKDKWEQLEKGEEWKQKALSEF